MGCLRDNLKHTPPSIDVFRRYGHGLIMEADFASGLLLKSLGQAQLRFLELEKFLAWAVEPKYPHDSDLVDVYGSWTRLDDLLRQLSSMEMAERRKHEALDKGKCRTLDAIEDEFADLSGRLAAWEAEAGKPYVYPVFNELLKRRLGVWEVNLDNAIRDGFQPSWEFWGHENDYRDERSLLEYTRMGVHVLRHCEPITTVKGFKRMEPLPYYEEFCARLDALDKEFREALEKGESSQVAPWADPSFWWYTPVTPVKKKQGKRGPHIALR